MPDYAFAGSFTYLYFQRCDIMTYCIAVFKSRSQAADCKSALVRAGIAARLTTTPERLKLGCGLSVQFPVAAYPAAKRMISRAGYSAFYGYMNV